MDEQRIRQIIREELYRFVKTDRFTFDKHVQLLDARNLQVGKTTGTKIGTEATQKLGFFGATPVVRQNIVATASGGTTQDTQARTAINAVIVELQNYGLMSTS